MSPQPGSCEMAAGTAARVLLEKGATRLESAIGAEVASFGEHCWLTDRALRERLRRPDGALYHCESIGRARRAMARKSWMISDRIHVGQPLPGKRRRTSAHGTTLKSLRWSILGVRDPLTRGERRRARIAAGERAPAPLGKPPRTRHIATPPLERASAELVAELLSGSAQKPSRRQGERVSPWHGQRVTAEQLDRLLAAEIEELDTGPPE